MSCKNNVKDRVLVIAFIRKLHGIVLKEQLEAVPHRRQLFRKALFATYVDLKDLGHAKAALWIIRRKPKILPGSARRSQNPDPPQEEVLRDNEILLLGRFKEAVDRYRLITDMIHSPEYHSAVSLREAAEAYYKLRALWRAALKNGFEKTAVQMLSKAGFNSKIFYEYQY